MLVSTVPSSGVSPAEQAPAAQAPGLAPLTPRAPLEQTGQRRDDARLLVTWRSNGRIVEARMADLPSFLGPGDVVVVNASATLPAALVVTNDLIVHLSTQLSTHTTHASNRVGTWVVELRHRCGHGSTPWLGYRPDGPVPLPGGGQLDILEPYAPATQAGQPTRLWVGWLSLPHPPDEYLAHFGLPVRYGCDAQPWPMTAYQTIFAAEPGSAEMPSAARGFTAELVTELISHGVLVTPIVLHTGVSSPESNEPPYPERYRVPQSTADAVNTAHDSGRRVIAVGTTATRAIETVAGADGKLRPGDGWTDLVITPERGVRAVDGLLTGWHDPEASHLSLVEAIAGGKLLDGSYAHAIDAGFNGHEFGDFHLILP